MSVLDVVAYIIEFESTSTEVFELKCVEVCTICMDLSRDIHLVNL